MTDKYSKTGIKSETERIYVIPLRRKFQHVARYKKTPKAVKTIKEFLVKHMKIYDRDLNKIKLDNYLNEALWRRGIKRPPHKIRVKATKDVNGIVNVELVDFSNKLKFKKARVERKAKEAIDKVAKQKAQKAVAQATTKSKVGESKTEDEKKQESEKKVVEKEKMKAGAETSNKIEKAAAKASKHQTIGKVKQPKRPQRKALAK